MTDGTTMRLKWVEDAESRLRPEQLEVWRAVCAKLPQGHDYGLEVFLISQVQRGATVVELDKFIPKHHARSGHDRRQHFDRRELAAGER